MTAVEDDLMDVLNTVGELTEVTVLQRRVEWNGDNGATDGRHQRLFTRFVHVVGSRSTWCTAIFTSSRPRPTVGLLRHRLPLRVSDERPWPRYRQTRRRQERSGTSSRVVVRACYEFCRRTSTKLLVVIVLDLWRPPSTHDCRRAAHFLILNLEPENG